MIDKIFVFENIVSTELQEKIKNTFFENQIFSWYFLNDVSKLHNPNHKRPGMVHWFMENKKINSDYFSLLNPIIENCNKKINKNLKPYNVRSFLQFPLNENFLGKDIDTPHLDLKIPHTVFLYYVMDSEADTVIYDYKSVNENDIPVFENINELKRIKPKQGSVLIFNGMYWHTAIQPHQNIRCVINMDMVN